MRYLLATVAILAVTLGTAVAAAPTFISARQVSAEIAERIGELTGGTVRLHGEPEISAFPSVIVKVRDVVVADEQGTPSSPKITVPALRASLKLLPLLSGRVEVDRLTLIEPRVRLDGSEGDSRLREALASAGTEDPKPRLGEIVMKDATVVYRHGKEDEAQTLAFAEFRIARANAAQAIAFSGRTEWCGKMVTIEGELENPRAAFAGSGSPGRLSVTLDPVLGQEAEGEDLSLTEQPVPVAKASGAPAMQSLAGWLDLPGTWSAFFGPFTMEGKLRVDETSFLLSDADFAFAGDQWKGRFAVGEQSARPLLDRLFSLAELDICSYAKTLYAADSATVRAMPLNAEWLADADLDLEVTSERAVFGGIALTDVVARLAAHKGKGTLDLEAADPSGGQFEIDAMIEQAALSDGPGLALGLSGRLVDLSVSEFSQAVWAKRGNPLVGTAKPPEGTATSVFDLSAKGDSLESIIASLSGWAATDIRDGSIDGANIVLTLEKLVNGSSMVVEGEGPFIPVAGRTHFTKLSSVIDIGSGVANVMQTRIAGDRFEIVLSGRSDLERGEVNVEGTASLFEESSEDGRARRIVELPFGVGGTLREPVIAAGVPRIGKRTRDSVAPVHSPIRLVRHERAR